MKRLFLIIAWNLFFFKMDSVLAKSNCENLETPAGKMSLSINGSSIKIDGHSLDTNSKVYSVISGANSMSPGTERIYSFNIQRNSQKQPTEIKVFLKGSRKASSNEKLVEPISPVLDTYKFSYLPNGVCRLSRILNDRSVLYDADFCLSLSNLMTKFTSSDLDKCSHILSQMAKTVQQFRKSAESEGLNLNNPSFKNSYEEALLQSAACRRSVGDDTKDAISIFIPKKSQSETVR